ncbi:hypothetical protein [Flavobacterium proteolyticum]|uniref:Uncharacterized protein n=1 Tax=Flavobacterium proteolyticum TaxID=2911683 RepID=A0ABR9WUA8_9FLAO|nr:hypothetical protein [Flavobacterium proteolyticum]MBE9577245.1 hypothetical protein [Flavobacterium proteolyticum]
MKPKIVTEKGWTEATIDDDCEFSKFYAVADLLSNEFNLTFSNKLNDFDTLYWDFEYKGNNLVLHYNIYLGISIFPRAFKSATQTDNELVLEISTLLFQKLFDRDWSDFENGETIGTKGSESGTIILDIENSNGARLTLEKECGSIPFAITIGIYGLMFHTHFESELEKANEYVTETKYRVNKIFDLYDVSEDKRDDYWHSKHDKKINELAEMTEMSVTKEKPAHNSTLPKAGRSWWQKLFGSE